jgi:beta-lactamase superfamily II metal-dependent hydrolase
MALTDGPGENIGEISLIGTGGGYGESCVIHVGHGNWIVIDSCIDPNTGTCLPLQYLNNIGLDVSKAVKLVLCTHWHDDHIRGMSTLFKLAKSAAFVVGHAIDLPKFLKLVSLDYQKMAHESSNVSTFEFNTCLETAIDEGRRRVTASHDKVLQTFKFPEYESSIVALSPSQWTMEQFDLEISTLMSEFGRSNRQIIVKSPNAKSVVSLIKFGSHRALMGADLECSADMREGWTQIIDHSQVIDKKFTFFKVSHHGSKNAYDTRIWLELLEDNPIATITPWNKRNGLPTEEMLKTLVNHTEHLYITSPLKKLRAKERHKTIEKMIKDFNPSVNEFRYSKGIIRSRIDILDDQSQWTVECFDTAYRFARS